MQHQVFFKNSIREILFLANMFSSRNSNPPLGFHIFDIQEIVLARLVAFHKMTEGLLKLWGSSIAG